MGIIISELFSLPGVTAPAIHDNWLPVILSTCKASIPERIRGPALILGESIIVPLPDPPFARQENSTPKIIQKWGYGCCKSAGGAFAAPTPHFFE